MSYDARKLKAVRKSSNHNFPVRSDYGGFSKEVRPMGCVVFREYKRGCRCLRKGFSGWKRIIAEVRMGTATCRIPYSPNPGTATPNTKSTAQTPNARA